MSIHSDRFNDLPFSAREIATALSLECEIRWLGGELNRLKKRYSLSKNEITEKVKYLESELRKTV